MFTKNVTTTAAEETTEKSVEHKNPLLDKILKWLVKITYQKYFHEQKFNVNAFSFNMIKIN